ncbi:FtsW/RodA/SpoVE family cell cycle protein [Sporomusa acidovorans]|uniref:Peptidoglycan glycosyltransferase MrdB n=1 Tax=Sporomusa acidovorans (strain ATCC 49682 / DSM 3132 / Mol) TaxID=1123286 RepID=A0ABZ3J6U7_SPOA4|nr:FtsW/RodA/SpoVE family cell cycle protein [Sporomusa acidovorans]OZC18559.1 lipid II flippase FtsW [Sporomusa acidovorans DSM 3132]SDE38323.1 cell division protein FtsW, lipid II flippase [Sporomusa acidovorans]
MSLEQNRLVQTYLDAVCAQIKWREVHGEVRSELLSHLEEIALELKNDGLPEQDAISTAIYRMGDAVDLGRQFQQTHAPQRNWPLVGAIALLSCLGLAVMHILDTSGVLPGPLHLFVKSVIFTGIGIAMLLWLHCYDFRKLRPYTPHLYAGTILLWLAVLMLGPSLDGKSFLALGSVSIGGQNHSLFINYIGITPFFLTLALAGIFIGKDWTNRPWTMKAASLLIIPDFLYMISGTAYLAVVFTLIFAVLMAVSGAPKIRIIGFLLMPFGLFLIKLALIVDNLSLFHIIRSADLWGQGISMPKALTAFHTDFVFLYLVHKFGWLAGVGTVAIGCAILLVLVRAVRQIKDQYGRMVVAGLAAYFTINFSWHVLMSLGLVPVASVSLPFVSFGGSQTVVNLAATGVILSIYKRKNLRNQIMWL